MATINFSNHGLAQINQANVNLSDNKSLILMESGFVFDPDTHATLANVTANELASGNGYTGAVALTADLTDVEDDTNNRSIVAFGDVTITPSGGSVGPTPGAIVYDDTSADDSVVFYIEFDSEVTRLDGIPLQINSIQVISAAG